VVLGTEGGQPLDVGVDVVGPQVEVGPHGSVRLVEALEEQLQGRAVVVVPLAGELPRLRTHPSPTQQRPPERHLRLVRRHR
jgi:hypothetical protein